MRRRCFVVLAVGLIVAATAACDSDGGGGATDVSTVPDVVAGDVLSDTATEDAGDPVSDVAVDVTPEDVASDTAADTGGEDTVDAGPPPSGFLPVAAAIACEAPTPLCEPGAADTGIYTSYRKDYFLPKDPYQEPLDDPLDGGRVHVAATSAVTGHVTEVRIGGELTADLLADLKLDWIHVWPEDLTAGEPVWVAFHSREASWDTGAAVSLRIETDAGTAVDGEIASAVHPFLVTYVTLSEDRETLLVHARNTDSAAHTVTRLLVDGRDVLAAGAACVPTTEVAAGASALWTVPLCQAPAPGSPWTVVVELQDAAPVAAVGRHLNPFFPIEAWQKGGDCPLPGANDEALDLFLEAGLDTFYFYWGNGGSCGYDNATMYNETLPARDDVFVLLGDDFPWDDPPTDVLTDTSRIAGILTGDESDWSYTTEEGGPKPENKARRSRAVWRSFPELLTYNGAMTNRHIGAFAGMTDVQGIDVYAAGCAPHIMDWGHHPPLRGPYDYLRNARNNHMPWPTWLYSQGLAGWSVGPDPQELVVQGFQVIAAGGKGLMWFQVGTDLAAEFPDSWEAISDVNWVFRGVRHLLRAGDITDGAFSDAETIVELIRAPDALVVPVITLAADEAPTDDLCFLHDLGQGEEPHWILTERTVSVTFDIPADMAVADLFEVFPDRVADVPYPVDVDGRTVRILDIPVSNDVPVHLFVLGSDETVRTTVAGRLRSE